LTLIGRIGADKAAYATLLFPIVALLLSTFFEGYRRSPASVAGVLIILAGNTLVVARGKRPQQGRRLSLAKTSHGVIDHDLSSKPQCSDQC
jgi:drug/metabolite transporter (DMT)-like permease